ncbi:MAG: carbonic anhydrase [Rubricella sp.]
MHRISPLPRYLSRRISGWKATDFADNRTWYARLAERGQTPRAMVVSCADSRVDPLAMFGAEPGDVFLVRNVANLIPPFAPDHDHHGTSAAIEYAVRHLGVAHIIVVGHSRCGGVEACYELCEGNAPELAEDTSFLGRWVSILSPSWEAVHDAEMPRDMKLREMERQGVLVSLANLLTFPWVAEAIEQERLTIHGLWIDIGTGELMEFAGDTAQFSTVQTAQR